MPVLLLALLLGANPDPPVVTAHVRAASPAVRALLTEADASPVVAALIERLEASDQVVYIEFTGSPEIPTARTKLVTATPRGRFLRIDLNVRLAPWDRLPLLAHELQHAVELAEAPDVTDDAGVRRLYERIGLPGAQDQFETAAARNVEGRVRWESARRAAGLKPRPSSR